jgi:hypothetical protein
MHDRSISDWRFSASLSTSSMYPDVNDADFTTPAITALCVAVFELDA